MSLRQQRVAQQYTYSWLINEKLLRKQLFSPPAHNRSDKSLDNLECMLQRCGECSGLKKLRMGPGSLMRLVTLARITGSESEIRQLWMTYHTKDGTEKVKKDFVSK